MPGRPCPVCVSPFRRQVDDGLRVGASILGMSRELQLPRRSIYRHRDRHVPGLEPPNAETSTDEAQVVKVEPDVTVPVWNGDARSMRTELMHRLEALSQEVVAVKDAAKQDGDNRLVLQAIDRLTSLVEKVGQMAGAIPNEHVILVADIPQWRTVSEVLRRHPTALRDVSEALQR